MRAAVYDRTAPEGIRVVANQRRPTLTTGHILVRVVHAGVNPVDAKKVVGDKLPGFLAGLASTVVQGNVAGFDFAGVVEAVSPRGDNSSFRPGDEVFGIMPPMKGSFAEVVACPADQLCLKPAALSTAEAAALPIAGLTAVQCFEQHGLRPGQRLLVVGATGGVGHLAAQVARAMGARVTGVCSARKLGLARALGCTHAFPYDDPEADVVAALQVLRARRGSLGAG